MDSRIKTIGFVFLFTIVLIIGAAYQPFSENDSGFRTHVQRVGGEEFVRFEPGWYYAGFFSKKTEYPDVVTLSYAPEEPKEDVTVYNQPFEIRFSDATKAMASATVRWKLPSDQQQMIAIHKEYRSVEKLAESTLSKYTRECLKYSAQLLESETHYSGGMSKMSEDFQDQLEFGQYVLDYKTEYVMDSISNERAKMTRTFIRSDAQGIPTRNASDIHQFGIKPTIATIDQVDYEEQVDRKLAEKIEASTRESISKQKLITATQEALTAIEEGKQLVEETRARENAAKEEAVIRAQKEKEVEKENALKAGYTAQKIKAEKDAEAAGNRALVMAGLSPQESAEWDYKTKVGVATALAGVTFPELLVIGGGDKGGSGTNPFDAVGLKALIDISNQMSKK